MKKVIGITGGIASGKSTVSNYLLSKNMVLVDCDLLTRQAYIDCFEAIKQSFPDCIDDHEISRPKLANRIFSNEQDKLALENIIHPYVRCKMQEVISKTNKGLVFLDIPLLYEAHMEDLCDEIWVVYVSRSVQLERLMKRNQMDEATANMRIDSQMSIEEKKEKADDVLDNTGTIETLEQQIKQRLEDLHAYID